MTYTTNEIIDAVAQAVIVPVPQVSLHLHPHNFTGAVVVWSTDHNELYTVEGLPLSQLNELFDDMPIDDYNIHWDADAQRSSCHIAREAFDAVLSTMLGAN